MDGLTITTANQILNTGLTTREITQTRAAELPVSPHAIEHGLATGAGSIGSNSSTQGSFATTLKDAINHVNAAQKEADYKMQELATGKSQNIHETMIAAEKADIALRLMVQVRNKMIEAYQEIMRMQV
jgi:flagellar hook-basal body complex protein FliE